VSREIKFRAWYKPEGKMYQVKALYLASQVPYVEWQPFQGRPVDENIELMEFTGVKDRNGKEIYEGDILGLDDPTDQSRAFVVFHNGAFRQQLVRLPIFGDDWDWLVIGNIYENPELGAKEGV